MFFSDFLRVSPGTSQIRLFALCHSLKLLKGMAGTTGLEPATFGVTEHLDSESQGFPTMRISAIQRLFGPKAHNVGDQRLVVRAVSRDVGHSFVQCIYTGLLEKL